MQDQRSPIEGVRRALGQRILINQHWRGSLPHVIRGETNVRNVVLFCHKFGRYLYINVIGSN